ncbi:MAG: hypothetical protein C0448_15200 [Sphingobacteriaceae bacterium]|nr:hypothetical protein [Sphingobacteriaceae bacterium]
MIIQSPYTLTVSDSFHQDLLVKDTWLVILHASRTPPHIGILIDGNYNSLTIKGQELDVDIKVLLKTIQQKKIETLFIKLKKHPVFSTGYQKEICQFYIKQFTQVKANEASCLSPIKLFLQEFYVITEHKQELLFELIERLKQNQYISLTVGLNIKDRVEENEFSLPMYTNDELQSIINTERSNYYKD